MLSSSISSTPFLHLCGFLLLLLLPLLLLLFLDPPPPPSSARWRKPVERHSSQVDLSLSLCPSKDSKLSGHAFPSRSFATSTVIYPQADERTNDRPKERLKKKEEKKKDQTNYNYRPTSKLGTLDTKFHYVGM